MDYRRFGGSRRDNFAINHHRRFGETTFNIDIYRFVVRFWERNLMHIELASQLTQRLGIFEAQQQHQLIGGGIVLDMFFDNAMRNNQAINREIA